MNKSIYFIALAALLLSSCGGGKSKKKKGNDGQEQIGAGTQNINSYSADTFYSDLKHRLVDLSASKNINELLCQGWIAEDDVYDLSAVQESSQIEIPIRSLHIFNDYTFIRNIRNNLEMGKWRYDDAKKEMYLYYDDGGGGDHYKIRAIAADELQLTDLDVGRNDVIKYVSDAKQYNNKMDDPFYLANNKWRKPPAKKETDEQIKQRVNNYLHFFVLFYKDAIAREAETVSFYGFPSCINWYSGGIYLKPEKELKDKWLSCFYNQAEAGKAYKILENVVDRKYNWPAEDINWIKKNLFVLEQMYKNL